MMLQLFRIFELEYSSFPELFGFLKVIFSSSIMVVEGVPVSSLESTIFSNTEGEATDIHHIFPDQVLSCQEVSFFFDYFTFTFIL